MVFSASLFIIMLYLPFLGTLEIRISFTLEHSTKIVLDVFAHVHPSVSLLLSWTCCSEVLD